MIAEVQQENRINLDEFRTAGVIVFSGRPKGVALRRKLQLDKKDADQSQVTIVVPNEVVSLNSSFFLGLFADSVTALGRDRFEQKYVFECPIEIREDIEDGIRQALDESNPIPDRTGTR
ncbi:MAG: hypothetical protein ABR526_05530 [Chthoniobacterales bacterium]